MCVCIWEIVQPSIWNHCAGGFDCLLAGFNFDAFAYRGLLDVRIPAIATTRYDRSRPVIPIDRDHPFPSIATSVKGRWVHLVILSIFAWGQAEVEAVPVVNRRDPRALRSGPSS